MGNDLLNGSRMLRIAAVACILVAMILIACSSPAGPVLVMMSMGLGLIGMAGWLTRQYRTELAEDAKRSRC